MPEITATVRTAAYTVSCLPEDDINSSIYSIKVEDAGRGRWAIRRMGRCLDANGDWDYEPTPSNREDDWLDAHRFDLDTALRLAQKAAPRITVNGATVEFALAHPARF